MSIDLAFDDAQLAILDAVTRFCADRCPEAVVRSPGSFSVELWRELAALGVLALSTPEGDGGAAEAVAALEALGAAVCPGPLAATFFATQLLPEAERCGLSSGERIVCVGTPPLMPFAPEAQLFIEVLGERAWRGTPSSEIEPVETLGGEVWGRVTLARGEALAPTHRAQALHDITLAAYVAAAGRRLTLRTVEHARTRVQFGRPIGEFQAVAHPLADASIRLDAATTLARSAACRFDAEPDVRATRAAAAAARLSARAAALAAAYTCHQVFGAVGITLEGPAFHFSRRIRQLASQSPGDGPAREALLDSMREESA